MKYIVDKALLEVVKFGKKKVIRYSAEDVEYWYGYTVHRLQQLLNKIGVAISDNRIGWDFGKNKIVVEVDEKNNNLIIYNSNS